MSLAVGTRLGPYEILSPLGAGGMGEVYRARDTNLKRDVALKILPDSFAHDPDRLARFEREAEVLASLNHPNIAHIHGLEDSGAVRALVMELVEGEDLAQRLTRGAMPIDEALPIAKQVAEALEAAHEQGIIHRDLKPANIKVTPDGRVKVLDFGLAKAMDPPVSSPSVSQSPTITTPAMTQAGMILGTAAYMSPEQARGKAVDKRADIWAFGCVVFEMLTGRRAFEAEDVSLTLAEVMKSEPDWSALPPSVSPALRTYLRRCLVKDPRQRIRDIGDVRLALEGALDMTPEAAAVSEIPLPRALWKRALPFIGTALLLVATAGVVWNMRPPQQSVGLTRFPFVLPQGEVLPISGARAVAISPDGGHIVYAASGQLYMRAMTDMESRPIQGTALGAGTPFFSPDGHWVGFYAATEHKLKKIAITGGAAVSICDADSLYGASWADDDRIYLGQGPKGVLRVSSNGGKPESLFTGKLNEVADGPQMLPGGDAMLVTISEGQSTSMWNRARIVVHSLKSGTRRTLIEGGSDAHYAPSGHLVYALGSTMQAVPFDVKTLQVTGGPVPIVEDVRRAPGGTSGAAQFAFSNNGSMVYVPSGLVGSGADLSLALVDRAGTRTPLNVPPRPYGQPRISPDGQRLAVHTDDGRERIVWIYDLMGASSMRPLTFGANSDRALWTLDSQRVVFRSDKEGDLGLFWQPADGSAQAERLAKAEQGVGLQPEAWSQDGKTLILSVSRGGDRSLSMMSLDGDHALKPLIPAYATNASVSSDGRWLAYSSTTAQRTDIFVRPFPQTSAIYPMVSDIGSRDPLWSPDGAHLFYLQNTGNGAQIVSVDVQTQPSFMFLRTTPLPINGIVSVGPRAYDITPDGKHFVVMYPKAQNDTDKAVTAQINVTLNWFEELKRRVPTK